jgi:hypothetical protein
MVISQPRYQDMRKVEVEWLVGDTPSLLITFYDNWSGNDFLEMVKEMSGIISSKADPVLIFVDFRANFTFPKQIINIINHLSNIIQVMLNLLL